MKRPAGQRWHFTVDGSVALLEQLPAELVAEGDTASAEAESGQGGGWFWSCTREGEGLRWLVAGPWTEDGARERVRRADATVLVPLRPDRPKHRRWRN